MRTLLRSWIAFADCALLYRLFAVAPAFSKLGHPSFGDRHRRPRREYLPLAVIVFALATGQVGFNCSPAAADAMPTNTIMNSFVKVEP
jgi:hypothetical protein